MFSKSLNFARAVRSALALLAAAALGGCYAYPAGYGPYYGYPATGVYEGYPYYYGYPGAVFEGRGDYGRGRPEHFGNGRPGDFQHGFHGGFGHPDARPGGLDHGGGNFHGGGGYFSHH